MEAVGKEAAKEARAHRFVPFPSLPPPRQNLILSIQLRDKLSSYLSHPAHPL